MKNIILHVVLGFQRCWLLLWTLIFSCLFLKKRPGWVVGTEEAAGNIRHIGEVIGSTAKVSLELHPYLSYKYDYEINFKSSLLRKTYRVFYGPMLLAYLASRYEKFFYVSAPGFLMHLLDGRDFEFRYLKWRKKKIACFFIGSEIRSVKLMSEFSKRMNLEVITTHFDKADPGVPLAWREWFCQVLAKSADKYADVIFNMPVDQLSYLKRETKPFIYLYSDNLFQKNAAKFESLDVIKIVHAPSRPLIKGTPLVRAAVERLKSEGYKIDYVELIGVPNTTVLKELREAHIVMNQFYAFVPGMFGIEAMAAHCAVMMSADATIETVLPPGSNEAWVVTRYYEVYEKLKALLDRPERLKAIADRGFDWAWKNASHLESGKQLKKYLELEPC